MKFLFQNKTYNFPTSLSQITLKQKIDYENTYGKELDEKYKKIVGEDIINQAVKNGVTVEQLLKEENKLTPLMELDLTEHVIETACKNFSFFSEISLDEVKNINIDQMLNVYYSCFHQLYNEDRKLENRYLWKGEYWYIEKPELSHTSNTTFNEFITAKQIVKNSYELGEGKWESLPFLCAIFLRKEGESFNENMIIEGSERLKLMYELPLDIALGVAFFLSNSMSIYTKGLQFSPKTQAEKVQI